MKIGEIEILLSRVSLTCLGNRFDITVKPDLKSHDANKNPRVFIQLAYSSECSKTGIKEYWKGRKWYLSEYMIADEIIKTCYAAFESCIKHEVLEGFKVDGKALFNPHIDFEELLKISDKEVKR